ncbi:MAG: DUF3108 domain-containing protein [Methylophilaceae bacterium]|nr:DUF3108 domain-containing protein [Methylophilaceae bacterium]
MNTLFKKLGFFNTQTQKIQMPWRWLWAILISVVIHLAVIGGWQIYLPDLDFSKHVIQAELALPPAKKPVMKPPHKRLVRKLTKQLNKASPTNTEATGLPASNSQSQEASASSELAQWSEADRPAFEELKPLPPPDHVEMDFEVKRTGFGSGKARYRFQLLPESRYSLRSEIEAVGLASLAFSGKRIETSLGKVTEWGLQPETYRYEISTKPEKSQSADFDWANKKITLTTAKSKETLDLPDDTQDFLSFMYQFMFMPPLDRMQHPLTNGKTLHVIDYLFVSEEQVPTKLGNLNTVHIAKSSGDTDEKTELWLAIDYRFIPIKILKLAKDGSGYELVVTRIDTDMGK